MTAPESPLTSKRTDIPTELGNRVLRTLLQSGWVIEYEYPDTAVDKGIDFNAYTLAKNGVRLEFEWDNWDEWQIRGSPALVQAICAEFAIGAARSGLKSSSDPLA